MWYNTKGKGSSDNMDKIIIKGARENNLKNIDIDIVVIQKTSSGQQRYQKNIKMNVAKGI